MASFEVGTELDGGRDKAFRLVQNGWISLFHRQSVLEDATTWLRDHGYEVVDVDCGEWTTEADLHSSLAAALNFPSYYGENMDAFNDCLSDVATADGDRTGFVLVLQRFDRFHRLESRLAHTLLDVFAWQARNAALFGHRLLCLVQTSDPRFEIADVGAQRVAWNGKEGLVRNRDL